MVMVPDHDDDYDKNGTNIDDDVDDDNTTDSVMKSGGIAGGGRQCK